MGLIYGITRQLYMKNDSYQSPANNGSVGVGLIGGREMENKKPCPRLELNWVKLGEDWTKKECIYSLVIPLGEYDIRHDNDNVVNGEMFLEIGRTQVTGGNRKPMYDGIVETPFRDGAHGYWDSLALNGVPVIAVCCEHWNVIDYGDKTK